ncbi:ECF transporter S component [Clostridium sardiniense]|uniref:ECF transporter S component n=1 Tax=Clostridium sardiniense TaxID=29369 RepID=UPI003D324C17
MKRLKNKSNIRKILITSMFIAIGIILPSIFHTFNMAGNIFLPMHIPILICAVICGGKYGGICGLIVPILSSFLTGMPPIFPVAIIMSLELGCYGLTLGILLKRRSILVSLIITLLVGRVVSCIANFIILGVVQNTFAFSAFLMGAFITALPGIIIQLILIPILYNFLKRRDYIDV